MLVMHCRKVYENIFNGRGVTEGIDSRSRVRSLLVRESAACLGWRALNVLLAPDEPVE
jgi:hypothetical protein